MELTEREKEIIKILLKDREFISRNEFHKELEEYSLEEILNAHEIVDSIIFEESCYEFL